MVENSSNKVIYVFPNKYHAECCVTGVASEEEKCAEALVKTARWFQQHIEDRRLDLTLQVLTSTYQGQKQLSDQNIKATSLMEFIKQHDSNLLDFLGFSEISTEKLFAQRVF